MLRARLALLLGYYADMLFKKSQEKFEDCMFFLLSGVNLTGEQKIIALQCTDTLKTIITDGDLIPRLEPLLPKLLEEINTTVLNISNQTYFSFLMHFVNQFAYSIGPDIVQLVDRLVKRI